MASITILTSLLTLIARPTTAQSASDAIFILNPTDCVAEPVTMSYCTSFMDKLDDCFYTSKKAVIASCFCPQSVLNYLAGCHQEWWDCVRSPVVDGLFTGTTGLYYTWSTMCTQLGALTYSPTTMVVTTPQIFDQQYCGELALDCDTLTRSMTACSSSYSNDPAELFSCLCNEDMLYYGSRCDVDANQKCLMTTLAPSLVYSNQRCGTNTIRTNSSPATSLSSSREPTSTYLSPMPTSTASGGAATTSAVNSNDAIWSTRDAKSMKMALIAVMVALF